MCEHPTQSMLEMAKKMNMTPVWGARNAALEEIDKSILHLQIIKEALTSSENQLRLANSKAEGLSIKRLTKNAPAVRAILDDSAADGGRT